MHIHKMLDDDESVITINVSESAITIIEAASHELYRNYGELA